MPDEDALQEFEAPASDDADVEVEREEDAPPVAELDPETRARRDAALRHVRKLGDPVLRAKALQVDRFDDQLAAEIERMGELMHDALGVGLAATLVNPVVEWQSEEMEAAEEGCLSLPGVHVEVERHERVRVRAQDAAGEDVEVEAEGLEARVIQHEVDHLDGVLILDRISREARKEAMRAMREAQESIAERPASVAAEGPPDEA
jgi:peptide deformylase